MRRKKRRHEKRAKKNRKSYANEEYQDFSEDTAASDSTEYESEASYTESKGDDLSDAYSREKCTEVYSSLELRMREIEAYMTSKKFRLHCEINRI